MKINFPANCNNEGSRWSYSVKLFQLVIVNHNVLGQGTTTIQRKHIKAVLQARNDQIEIAQKGLYWSPKIPDHVSGGVISYPTGLNQANEGSRGIFLLGLANRLALAGKDSDDIDVKVVREVLNQAKIDAKVGTFWSPSLGDIVNGD